MTNEDNLLRRDDGESSTPLGREELRMLFEAGRPYESPHEHLVLFDSRPPQEVTVGVEIFRCIGDHSRFMLLIPVKEKKFRVIFDGYIWQNRDGWICFGDKPPVRNRTWREFVSHWFSQTRRLFGRL